MPMPARRKKLIEVALPLEAINKESAREKSIRHGHPSTLHLWWARRPLAACRAVLFAQLVDDPESDPAYRHADGSLDEERAGLKRAQLFNLIEELVKWENSNDPRILHAARAEIARCVASRLIEQGKLQKETIIYAGVRGQKSGDRTKAEASGDRDSDSCLLTSVSLAEGQPHPKGPLSGEFRTAWELIIHGHGDLESLDNRTTRLCPPGVVNHFLATYAPPVLDPFAGGGSIPLEAQRLGLRAHASDLNPVPVLINKALIEIPPRFAGLPPVNPEDRRQETADSQNRLDSDTASCLLTPDSWSGAAGLAADVRYYGQWMRDRAEERIGHLYPKVTITKEMANGSAGVPPASSSPKGRQDGCAPRPDLKPYVGQELTVIAWLWARTVRCQNPACGRRMPMLRSFWLSKKKGKKAWADPILDHDAGTVTFKVRHKGEPPEETSNRTMARCLFCGDTMKKAELRKTASEHGMQEIPLAVVCEGNRGRVYLDSTYAHVPEVDAPTAPEIDQLITDDKRWFSPPQYGLPSFRDLFTSRQLTALVTFSDLVGEARAKVLADATAPAPGHPFAARSHPSHPPRDENTPPRDENNPPRDESSALRDENTALRDENGAPRDENSPLRDENSPPRHADNPQRHANNPQRHANSPPRHADNPERHADTAPRHANNAQMGENITQKASNEAVRAASNGPTDEAAPQPPQPTTTTTTRADDPRPLAQGGTGPQAYADAIATYLGMGLSRLSDATSSLVRWKPSMDQAIGTFGRQALPMVWDFAESNPFNHAAGDLETTLGTMIRVLERMHSGKQGNVEQKSAADSQGLQANPIVSTDPPYYDNIGYADLSDFFYVWLRRSLHDVYPDLLSTLLTPKAEEMIASPYRHEGSKAKAAAFFEEGLGSAIEQWRQHGCPDYPTTIFYAFKQAETDTHGTASTGWETFLDGVINHGFAITGTWPMRTELSNRMVGSGTNALASSVVLACVPREADAPLATRRELLTALQRELPGAMRLLQSGNIAPVDLAQAAIGPGMAVFSRYAKVLESDGEAMTVRTALTLINQTLDEVLAEQEGEFDADTRWAVAWFEQYGVKEGEYGVAETLSKAKNTSVAGLAEAGVVSARGGKVKLVAREDLPGDWDPTTDSRATCWEATQHLIRRLQEEGEQSAAELLARLGGDFGEKARDLAYRLYVVSERKGWAHEALAYNAVVIAWGEIAKLARSATRGESPVQKEMFLAQ